MPGSISESYDGPDGPEWDEARKAMEEFVGGGLICGDPLTGGLMLGAPMTFSLRGANQVLMTIAPDAAGKQLAGEVKVYRPAGDLVGAWPSWSALCDALDRRPQF